MGAAASVPIRITTVFPHRSPNRCFVSDRVTFWDIGTVADYWHTSQAWLARESPDAWRGASSYIDPQARVTKSIVWDNVIVPRHCEVDECILTDGVRLPEGGAYRRSILLADGEHNVIVEALEI